jgi:RTX calcium-binding nonapeptide repeat (4 copies)
MRASRTRIWGVAATAAALAVVAPSPALAGTARLKSVSDPDLGATQVLVYRADSGERNVVNASFRSGSYILSDSAGVTPGAGCVAQGPAKVGCALAAGTSVGGIAVFLRDRGDSAVSSGAEALISGGRGSDRLSGSSSPDSLLGGPGNDRLRGGGGQDELLGGSGDDRIRARDTFPDAVSCGSGQDRASLDALDYFPGRCERVRRTDPGGATVLDLLSSNSRGGTAGVAVGCPRDAVGRCRGTVSIRRQGRSLGKARFNVRRRRIRFANIRLPADIVQQLRQTGLAVTVVLKVREGRLHRTVTVPQLLPRL